MTTSKPVGETLFYGLTGSRAYGTFTPESDYDYRGVFIPTKEYVFGFLNKIEELELEGQDNKLYEVKKFFFLAADANPNVLEVLFLPEYNKISKLGQKLLDNRDLFITKKARHTFAGYAFAQLKRLELHRRWILKPNDKKPLRSDYDLQEFTLVPKDQLKTANSKIKKELDRLGSAGADKFEQEDQVIEIGTKLGFDTNFLYLLQQERRYGAAMQEYEQYQNWKKNRNPARAEMEAKFGMDLKHCTHLVRLLRMCNEILSGKGVIVKRPDAEELKEIRSGSWKYENLIDYAKRMDLEAARLYEISSLPREANRAKLDELCIEILEEFYRR